MGSSDKKKKVLVVDDDLHMRIFISTLLETSGYKAIIAKNGDDGIRKTQESLPALIILDLMMPGEGGILMYQQLRTDDRLKHIPVIVLSGVESKVFYHSLKTLSVGLETVLPEPDVYMEKPPNPEELLQKIESVLKPIT